MNTYKIYNVKYIHKMSRYDADQSTTFKNEHESKPPPKPSFLDQPPSKLTKTAFILSLIAFTLTLIIRIKTEHSEPPIKNQHISEAEANTLDMVGMLDLGRSVKKQDINQLLELEQQGNGRQQMIKKRISMGAPSPIPRKLKLVIITIKSINKTNKKSNCLFTNAFTILTPKATKTANQLLIEPNQADLNVRKWVIFIDSYDPASDAVWKEWVAAHQTICQFLEVNVTVDSQYGFIRQYVQDCAYVIYTQNSFQLQVQSLTNVLTPSNFRLNTMLYSSRVLDKIKNNQSQLQDLNGTNLQKIPPQNICKYLFIFDSKYINIITPMNFAYYAKYTLDEILIWPILVIVQGSSALTKIQKCVHGFQTSYVQNKQLSIVQVNKYPHIISKTKPTFENRSEDLCFVSYPLQVQQISLQLLISYIQSLSSQNNKISLKNSTIVINLPYHHKSQNMSDALYKSCLYLLDFVDQGVNKTVSSLAVYEAAYTYCPNSSIIISSRHNIKFRPSFAQQLLVSLSLTFHYYLTQYQDSLGAVVKKPNHFSFRKNKFRQQALYYNQTLIHLQIFKSDLFKMMYFWILKCSQIDFYETQASFVIPLLQMTRLRVTFITQPQFSLSYLRSMSKIQQRQLQNLKLYYQWTMIPQNYLKPFIYNSLQNEAFRRWAPQKIPKIIHQAWIGNKPVSDFQQKLQQTLKETNKGFQVNLWRDQNITLQNFPLTYALIKRSLQYQKYSNRSYSAPIVSLIRYQLLYQYGGIYIDFKTQGKKDLSPFLKYQMFFIDVDYEKDHYKYPANVGNGIMGTTKNNYHLRLILTQLIYEQKFNYKLFDFPRIVGGYVLRKILTDRELFTVAGYGFQLFSQKPGTGKPNQCSTILKTQFDSNQKVYQVQDYSTQKFYKIAIPCKIYQQAYLIMYKVLAGTWKPKKKQLTLKVKNSRFQKYKRKPWIN